MAKNLSIRFTASSSEITTTATATSSASNELSPGSGTNSTAIDDDSDSEERHRVNSPSGSEMFECGVPFAAEVNDRCASSPAPPSSNSKKKKNSTSVTSKMDKFVKQFQESFNSSKDSQSKKEGGCGGGLLETINDSPEFDIDITDTVSFVPSVEQPSSTTTTTTSKCSNWLNEMKFKLSRPDKKCLESSDCEQSSSRKGSPLAPPPYSRGLSSNWPTDSLVTSTNQQWQPSNGCKETFGGAVFGRQSPTSLLAEESAYAVNGEPTLVVESLAPLVYINSNKVENAKEKRPSSSAAKDMFRDKEWRKSKSTSVSNKKSKDDKGSGSSSNFMKQFMSSPRSNSISVTSTIPNGSVPRSSSSQLSPINKNVSRSCSSSTENLSFIGDSAVAPKSKKPTKPVMISFRKSKNDNDEISFEDLSSLLITSTNLNPTLRRRLTGVERQDSPTNDSASSHEDAHSAHSSSVNSIAEDLFDTSTEDHQHHPRVPHCRKAVVKHCISLFSWTSSFSGFYYIFCLVVALVAFTFCIISPLPHFLNGFILGFLWTFIIVSIIFVYLICNYFLVKRDDDETMRLSTSDSVSIKRPKSKKATGANSSNNSQQQQLENTTYLGWVFEFIGDYEEREKNGFQSRLVHIALSGSKLTISTPSQGMSEKKIKQILSETNRSFPSFTTQRVIDFGKLKNKRVTLYITKNVRNVRKYIWSKKYPICLEFSDDRAFNGEGFVVKGERCETPGTPEKSLDKCAPFMKLVIFARTCREKEEWFWALKTAIDSTLSTSISKCSNSTKSSAQSLSDCVANPETELLPLDSGEPSVATQQQYLHILTRRINYASFIRTNVLNIDGAGSGSGISMMTPLTWFNMLTNRLAFDILNKPNWSRYIAKKLQRKLRKLRLPYFMESLTITEIDIGDTLPKFQSVPSVPSVDDGGLWIDFDVSYSGGFTMTLETRLNLMKMSSSSDNIKSAPTSPETVAPPATPLLSPTDSPDLSIDRKLRNSLSASSPRHWVGYKYRPAYTNEPNEELTMDSDSDLDSIVTSSEDEEPDTAPADPDDADTDEKQKKFTRFIDKITNSSYFQKATQLSIVKKALVGVSNMSLMLTVQINSLNGTLAINIPESPTDRLWYGFRNDPSIQITARPKLGDHDVNLSYVTNFIEKKLKNEFFNYFVIPNMDDFFIPALNTNIEQHVSLVP